MPMMVCKVCQAHKKPEDEYVKSSRSSGIPNLVREKGLKLLELNGLKSNFRGKHVL